MATAEYGGGVGGKFRRQPLRGARPTPYDRPPAAARGVRGALPATEAGGRGWLSKLLDPASRLITRGAFRLFSSVFQKRLTAPPEPTGQSLSMADEAPKVEFTPELKENDVNTTDALTNNGNGRPEQETKSDVDVFDELELLVKQKTFTRSETELLTKLLISRTVEPSTSPADHKNKGKVYEQSNIDPTSSQPAVNHDEAVNTYASELEGSRVKLARLCGGINSGVGVTIPEGDAVSPIEVAKAYMGCKTLVEVPSTLTLRSPMIRRDTENDYMTPKLHGRSALYKMSRPSNYRTHLRCSPYKESYTGPTRSFEATKLSNVPGYRQAQKRGSLDRDEGLFSHARRVRQRSSLKDLPFSTCVDISSTNFVSQDRGQHSANLDGVTDVDGRIPLENFMPVPPRSTDMARKILHQLDKLVPSPGNKSSETKAIAGDASSSKSPSLEKALTISGNDGHKYLKDPGNGIFSKPANQIKSFCPPIKFNSNKDYMVEDSQKLSNSADKAAFSLDKAITSAKHCIRTMGSNTDVIGGISTPRDATLQSAENDKAEHTIEEHAILTPKTEPREEPMAHSSENVHISQSIHGGDLPKASSKPLAEADTSCTSKTLSRKYHLSPNVLSTLAGGGGPKEGNVVTPFNVGSKGSIEYVSKPMSAEIVQSTTTKEAIVSCKTSETSDLGIGGNMISAGFRNPSSSATPMFSSLPFQFGSGVSSTSSTKDGNSTSQLSSLNPVTGGNVNFSFNAPSASSGSSTQFGSKTSLNAAGILNTTTASSFPSHAASTGTMASSFPQNSVSKLGSLDSQPSSGFGPCSLSASCSSQFGSAFSGAKSFGLSSGFSFSAGSTATLSMASSTTNFPISFSAAQLPSSLPSSSNATLGSTVPSTSFSFGTPASASSSMPFLSSTGSSFLFASSGNTTAGSPSPAQSAFELPANDQMDTEYSMADDSYKAAPMAQTVDPTTSSTPSLMSSTPSAAGAQIFHFGAFQNNSAPQNSSPFQASGTVGFSAGGSFSLGSGGGEKSERKFIRVRRDKIRRK